MDRRSETKRRRKLCEHADMNGLCSSQAKANGLCKKHNKLFMFPTEKTKQFTKDELKQKLCEIVDLVYKD